MFNLIRMDVYRMFRSLSTWVILLMTALMAVFCVSMTELDLSAMAEDPAYEQQMTEEASASDHELMLGYNASTDPGWIDGEIRAADLVGMGVKSGLLGLLCVIFTPLFVNAEQKNGYVKNIAGSLKNRGTLALSKLAAVALQTLLMTALFAGVLTASGLIFWGDRVTFSGSRELLQFLGVQYLLHLGFAALTGFLCVLTKSTAFSMTAGILMSMGMLLPIYSAVNRAAAEFLPALDLDITRYMLETNISLCGIGAETEVILRAAVTGILFFAVSAVLAALILKKRDVR